MLAYYTFNRTGKGTDDDSFRPDVPADFTSWSVIEERDDDFLVQVEAPDDWHADRSGKVAEEVIEYETVQVPVSRKLIDRRDGGRDGRELESVDRLRTSSAGDGGDRGGR